ncbi:MAG TPA: universal stress protein [Acidimicrobiia bacterium]
MDQRYTGPVVVGVDGSEQSIDAARAAAAEAALRDVQLHVVHCVDIQPAVLHLPGGTTDTVDIAKRQHEKVHDAISDALGDVTYERVGREGYPPDELIDYTEQVGAGLLVLGSRGRGRIAGAVLGSTSLRCLEQSKIPVLIVK